MRDTLSLLCEFITQGGLDRGGFVSVLWNDTYGMKDLSDNDTV